MLAENLDRAQPRVRAATDDELIQAIQLCFDCSQRCMTTVNVFMRDHQSGEFRDCVNLVLECAEICTAAGEMATRHTGPNGYMVTELLLAAAIACDSSAVECGRHSDTLEHCRACEHACRACASACRAAAAAAMH